ncbi:MAG: single-stranded DNA-binding protein [Bacillota bacterium]
MNKAFLIGNLTKDPEVRTTHSGASLCSFTIAVNRRFTDADGTRQADFIPIVAWRRIADLCGRYLAKGRKVAVIGEIQTRRYDAKDGSKRSVTEVVADEVKFLFPRERKGETQPEKPEELEGLEDIRDDDPPY